MLNKLLCFILLFLFLTQKGFAFLQQPAERVRVELYVYLVDPNHVGKPVKRLPPAGLTAYVGNGSIYVQGFEKSFTLRLSDANNGTDMFSTNVTTGQTAIPIPKGLSGDFIMDFIFDRVTYRTQIHL